MLEIVLFLSGIRKEQETAGGVLTGQFGPTDTSSSQHSGVVVGLLEGTMHFALDQRTETVKERHSILALAV